MIRLIPVGDTVRQQQPPSSITSAVRPKEKHSSPEIRLGFRRRRATTVTLPQEQAPTSISQDVQQGLIHQSFIQQHHTPADEYKPLAKIRMQTNSFLPEQSGTCSTINGLGEINKKAQGKGSLTGRQIIKLKHHKQRAFSPIQKLVPLLSSSLLEEFKTVNM